VSDLEGRMCDILRRTPGLMRVLAVARDLALPDWMVFSGAVYQPVWNHLTGRPPDYGVNDYDLAYFDADDLSYEAEDAVIRRAAAAFEPPLRAMVEVRNQARVHLWFEAHFGESYGALASSAEALTRFTSLSPSGPAWRPTTRSLSSRRWVSTTSSPCASALTPCAPPPASPAPSPTPEPDGPR